MLYSFDNFFITSKQVNSKTVTLMIRFVLMTETQDENEMDQISLHEATAQNSSKSFHNTNSRFATTTRCIDTSTCTKDLVCTK